MDAVKVMQQDRSYNPYRASFPIFDRENPMAFLDTAASAQKPQAVVDSMTDAMTQNYANIHRGLYRYSQEMTKSFEAVRATVKPFVAASSIEELIFTRNTTEAINLVAQSWGRANLKQGDEIILTEMEHHANIVPWQLLQKEIGFEIKVVPVLDDGTLCVDAFAALLSEKTKFFGLVHISNALGTINPAKEMIAKAKAFNSEIICLLDGSQSVVHTKVDVQALGCDFFTFTGHKLYGPTGIGVLYGRKNVLEAMPPFLGGGDMIDRVSFAGTTFKGAPARFEAGTPPIVEVIGLGAAINWIENIGMNEITTYEQALMEYTVPRLREIEGLRLYADLPEKAPVLSFNIDGVHHSDIAMILDQCGVAVRTGHHCCMPLMDRLGVDGTVRASFGVYTNYDDCDALIEGVKKAKRMLL